MASKIIAKICQRKNIASKTVEVSFELQNNKFTFLPGQYIQVRLIKLLYEDLQGESRLLSIIATPSKKRTLSVAFRSSSSGFKKSLLELPIGSEVYIEGPYGYLTLPQKFNNPIVFIAGGIGIAPFITMIRFAQEEKYMHQITLLYSNRSRESAAYLKELEQIAKGSDTFNLKTLYKPITLDFVQNSIKNPKNCMWYVAGSPIMVYEVKYNILANLLINSDHIFTEEFV
jgi:ferredoxin-NADP reductase